jgi:drug/metabolite transporter (DMT)-like permease
LPAPARTPAFVAAARDSVGVLAVIPSFGAGKNLSANLRGIILMLISTVAFAAMHAAVRHLSGELHPFEIAFFRNAFGLLVLAPWFLRYGLAPLRTRRLPLERLRALGAGALVPALWLGAPAHPAPAAP